MNTIEVIIISDAINDYKSKHKLININSVSDICEVDLKKYNVIIVDMLKININILNKIEKSNNKNIIIISSYISEDKINLLLSYNLSYSFIQYLDLLYIDKIILDNYFKKYINNINVSYILLNFGIPNHLKGFIFLEFIINYLLTNNLYCVDVMMLYRVVSDVYDVSISNVERTIRYAISIGFDRNYPNFVDNVFKNSISKEKGKPTNSEFILRVVNYIYKSNSIGFELNR